MAVTVALSWRAGKAALLLQRDAMKEVSALVQRPPLLPDANATTLHPMRTLRLMRRLSNGMPCMLLATLLLLSHLVAPSMVMKLPSADPVELALQTICHTDAPAQPGEPSQPDHTACLVCPACHMASHTALPTPAAPVAPPPPVVAIGVSAPMPPATGPPSRVRTAAQPTGPPTLSA